MVDFDSSNDLSRVFHQLSKDHNRVRPQVPEKYSDWPEEWKTTYYKEYPRFESISLSAKEPAGILGNGSNLFNILKKRRSARDFSRKPLNFSTISALLKFSFGESDIFRDDRPGRTYPSGGGRFPLEVYLVNVIETNDKKIPAGFFHYNVKNHSLEILSKENKDLSRETIKELFSYQFTGDASLILILTAVFWRNQNKYGERGYRYVLLEAGHAAQNCCLVGEALDLKICPLAGTRDNNIEKHLCIDGENESVIYALALG